MSTTIEFDKLEILALICALDRMSHKVYLFEIGSMQYRIESPVIEALKGKVVRETGSMGSIGDASPARRVAVRPLPGAT
jgi:hypothetical protein